MPRSRVILINLVLAAVLLPALDSHAYNRTCGQIRAGLNSPSSGEFNFAAGYPIGVIDELAGLLCYVGNSQCDCLRGLLSRDGASLGSAVARGIFECADRDPNEGAFGSVTRVAREFCPF